MKKKIVLKLIGDPSEVHRKKVEGWKRRVDATEDKGSITGRGGRKVIKKAQHFTEFRRSVQRAIQRFRPIMRY